MTARLGTPVEEGHFAVQVDAAEGHGDGLHVGESLDRGHGVLPVLPEG